MATKKRSLNSNSEGLGRLRELLYDYLGQLDSIEPSLSNIFKQEDAKIDLETKVWHHFHKLEAATYHYERVNSIAQTTRKRLQKLEIPDMEGSIEMQFAFSDKRILFELEGFFASVQSALDFLACVLSRYVRGKNTDEYDELQKFLKDSFDPIAVLVNEAWINWAKGCSEYRNYLLHRGVLPLPKGTTVIIRNPRILNKQLERLEKFIQKQDPVVFPLPITPNPGTRMTRNEISGLTESKAPPGILVVTTILTVSSGRASLEHIESSASVESEVSPDSGSNKVRLIQHKLEPGYIEAETLCKEILMKLNLLSFNIFSELNKNNFRHIA